MISCDYCNLNWHMDCLEPPLAVVPNAQRKWQCPNHAEQAMVSDCIREDPTVADLTFYSRNGVRLNGWKKSS